MKSYELIRVLRAGRDALSALNALDPKTERKIQACLEDIERRGGIDNSRRCSEITNSPFAGRETRKAFFDLQASRMDRGRRIFEG